MNRKIVASSLFAIVLLGANGCLGSPRTKIVLVRDRVASEDPNADIGAIERRLACAGARDVEVRLGGDTAEFTFSASKIPTLDWTSIATRPGFLTTTPLVGASRIPSFLPTLHLRLGRDVDLLPDVPGREYDFAPMALIVPARKSSVDSILATIEFISILGQTAIPAWGAMPAYSDKDGAKRPGAQLFLLPPRRAWGGPISNEVVDSAVFVAGSDSSMNGVDLRLNRQGKAAYLEMTQELTGTFVAILVDDQVLGAVKVAQPVDGERFTVRGCGSDCQNLAAVLGGGPIRGVWRLADK